MLVFEERRKPEYLEKNLLEQGREPTTNSITGNPHDGPVWKLNLGHIGGGRVLSPQRHVSLLPQCHSMLDCVIAN